MGTLPNVVSPMSQSTQYDDDGSVSSFRPAARHEAYCYCYLLQRVSGMRLAA